MDEDIPEDINMDANENELNENVNENSNSNFNSNSGLNSGNQRSRSKSNKNSGSKGKNKNKKNKKKKQPFLISVSEDSSYPKVKITINACSFCDEYMMPIWCPKNVYIKFAVEGKWRIDKKYDYTNSRGLPSNNCKGFNYGALIGRIGKGENFLIVDKSTILVKKEGPLFLRQNLPKRVKLEPEGKLIVTVYDGQYMEIQDINEKIGWIENGNINVNQSEKNNSNNNINIISTNKNNEINEKELEKGLISNINNLRMNPTMYYEKYISFNSKYIWTKEYLEKIKDEIRDPLGEDKKANDYIIEYFNISKIQMLTKKLHKNKITETLSEMDETLRYLINEEVGSTKIVKVKSIITQKENPIDIIVQYLLDKKYRSNIFDPYSKALTIKIIKNFYNNSALVVIVIIQDKDNVLLDEPTSM